jgi:DNA-binding transcriptional regulator YiaG
MSVHMKKHLTNIEIDGKKYIMPVKRKKIILTLVKEFSSQEEIVDSENILKKIAKGRPKGAIALRGARVKTNVSQKELSKKTGVDVANISKYENGTRLISEKMAKKFAKVLNVSFKIFLD